MDSDEFDNTVCSECAANCSSDCRCWRHGRRREPDSVCIECGNPIISSEFENPTYCDQCEYHLDPPI